MFDRFARKEQGTALLVSLMMLLLLTVLAVAAVNMTSLGLRTTASMQDQQLAEAVTQAVIDEKLSGGATYFRGAPSAENVARDGYSVALEAPVCLGWSTAGGFEENYDPNGMELNRFNNAWRVVGSVSGSGGFAGEAVTVTQGVVLKVDIVRCAE